MSRRWDSTKTSSDQYGFWPRFQSVLKRRWKSVDKSIDFTLKQRNKITTYRCTELAYKPATRRQKR